jgi:hypothetical protein
MRKPSRETRIMAHSLNMLAIFPNATEQDPFTLYRKLRRLEARAARIALQLCNGPDFARESEPDELFAAVLFRVRKLLGDREVPIFINRDPRGYQLKIKDDWMTAHPQFRLERDWGGYGILAPEIK